MSRSIIQYTTGTPGTGKSYLRCPVFLINEFLPDSTGVHYSNFPIGEVNADHKWPPKFPGETFIERIAECVAANTGRDASEFEKRMQIIPEDELKKWENDVEFVTVDPETGKRRSELRPESGPWEYFKDKSLAGAHIAIDECHNFIGRKHSKKHREMWQAWLGEIRHQGATVEFLSQSHMKVAKEIAYEAALRRTLESTEDLRPPWFGFPLREWYNVKAKITGKYSRMIVITEKVERNERWVQNHREIVMLRAEYFRFYNSFNKPQKGGEAGQLEKADWQKYSLARLILRIPYRYPIAFATRLGFVAFLTFLFFGGGRLIVMYLITRVGGVDMDGRRKPSHVDQDKPAQVMPSQTARTVRGVYDQDVFYTPTTETPIDAAGQPVPAQTDDNQPVGHLDDERYQQLLAQIQTLQAAVEEYAAKETERAAVVMVTPDSATMRGGYTYAIGDTIDFGEFVGHVVERIDYPRRAVYLSDGVVLRLGRLSGETVPEP